MNPSRKCKICGKDFIPNRQRKYCSKDCYKVFKNKWFKEKIVKCPICEKEFLTRTKRKYCSNRCISAYLNEYKNKKLIRNCEICGIDFSTNHPTKKYCSSTCIKIYKKKYSSNYTKLKPEINIKNNEKRREKRDLIREKKISQGLIMGENKPHKYWTPERIFLEAAKYNSRSAWNDGSAGSYFASKKLGIYDEATKHMSYIGNKYKRCIYRILLPKQNLAYIGLTFNFKQRIRDHLKTKRFKDLISLYGRQSIEIKQITQYLDTEEAAKYETKLINVFKANGWKMLNAKPGGGIGGKEIVWSREKILETTQNYNSFKNWRKNNHLAYNAARPNKKLMEEIYKILPEDYKKIPIRKWTREAVMHEALKFKTKNQWHEVSPSSYDAAKKFKIFEDAISHMKKPKSKMSDELIKIDALKYKRRSDWAKFSATIWRIASKRKDFYNRVTAHMSSKWSRKIS